MSSSAMSTLRMIAGVPADVGAVCRLSPLRTSVGDWQRCRILGFVQEFGRREGYSPSLREISEELGLAVSTVSYHVSVLGQDGSLAAGPGSRGRS
jgi:DNA-binding transcriptional ArsR family regulator